MSFVRFTSVLAVALLAAAPGRARGLVGTFLYSLSDSNGPVASSWASLSYDPEHKELYVVDVSDGTVGVFNDVGMEVYRFGDDEEIGNILAIQALENGELLALANRNGHASLVRCDFRGQLLGRIELHGVPPEFAKAFTPGSMVYRGGKIYLGDLGTLKIVVADVTGACLEAHDFFRELGIDKERSARGGTPDMRAFYVDAEGNILFTVSALFRAYVVSPGGKFRVFGERGSAPGKFNIVGGIARDERGNFLVTDILRSVVMVFDPELQFRGEFAERGWDRDTLIAPLQLAIAPDGKIFISQSARRGVSVFQLNLDQAAPAQR